MIIYFVSRRFSGVHKWQVRSFEGLKKWMLWSRKLREKISDLPPSKLGGASSAPRQVRTGPISSRQQAGGYPAGFL
jgi:hypothetical protein